MDEGTSRNGRPKSAAVAADLPPASSEEGVARDSEKAADPPASEGDDGQSVNSSTRCSSSTSRGSVSEGSLPPPAAAAASMQQQRGSGASGSGSRESASEERRGVQICAQRTAGAHATTTGGTSEASGATDGLANLFLFSDGAVGKEIAQGDLCRNEEQHEEGDEEEEEVEGAEEEEEEADEDEQLGKQAACACEKLKDHPIFTDAQEQEKWMDRAWKGVQCCGAALLVVALLFDELD